MTSNGAVVVDNNLGPPLPPRYRLRDLLLGDHAYADDGDR